MLTDTTCRNATCPPGLKRERLADDGGLYLEVSPAGSKRWFWKFRVGGKEHRLALGRYPDVPLKQARADRDAARKAKDSGINPVQQRKADRLTMAACNATTFEAVAREFHGLKKSGWSAGHATKWIRACELHLFPSIGTLPLASIKVPVLVATLRKLEANGNLSTAQDLQAMLGQIFRFGVQTGRCDRNPAADLRGSLKPHVAKHFAAVLEPARAGELLRAIDGYAGQPTTRAALQLAALLFQRPGNVRAMEWTWVDLDNQMITIPASAMKLSQHGKLNGRPHMVPLAKQSVAVLKSVLPLTGTERYVFPGARTDDRPMSNNTMNAALRRLDFGTDDHVAHGFRAMARTLLAEQLKGVDAEVVEAQLGHGKSGPLGAAYDRAEYLEQRCQIMQRWADYLDRLREGAQIVEFKGRAA